jgi:hypothetical protein
VSDSRHDATVRALSVPGRGVTLQPPTNYKVESCHRQRHKVSRQELYFTRTPTVSQVVMPSKLCIRQLLRGE